MKFLKKVIKGKAMKIGKIKITPVLRTTILSSENGFYASITPVALFVLDVGRKKTIVLSGQGMLKK